jgi:ribonuclease P protein component
MIGRIVRPADFERVLATAPCSRSTHFAVHHVSGRPSLARTGPAAAADEQLVRPVSPDLSTALPPAGSALVDESSTPAPPPPPEGRWLGLVVPKRHAKRAVTRNLIKRQIRAAMAQQGERLATGLWVVRLRLPFDKREFTSPSSERLREATHREIGQLFTRAVATRGAGAST